MKGLKRFFASMKTAYDHERALRGMFRLGKLEGRKEQPMTVYRQCCERHGTRLQAVGPGIFVCGSCRVEANLPAVIANVERVTGPMQPLQETTDPLVRAANIYAPPPVPPRATAHPTRPLYRYLQEQKPQPGPQTLHHRATRGE